MTRPSTPLPPSYFETARPPLGAVSLTLALDEVRVRLDDADEALATALGARFAPYLRRGAAPDPRDLCIAVRRATERYFIDPPQRAEYNPILLACDGDRVRYLGYRVAAWFDPLACRGELALAGGDFEPAVRSVENLLRAAVAWRAATLGGALVHAASAVRDGHGYLFYGESGAGKSTLSASNRRGRVVSDDLSLVLGDGAGGLRLVGSPFRGTYEEGPPVEGSFPVRAGYRLVQAAQAEVRPVSRVVAFAQLVGNLPFVAEAYRVRPDLFERVRDAFRDLPLAELAFRPDDSFWDAIDAAGHGAP